MEESRVIRRQDEEEAVADRPDGTDETGLRAGTARRTDAGRGGRPRDTALDERILQETFTLLAEVGLHGLRIDQVATRAGVPKSTIYRRWRSLPELAVDAVDAALGPREFPAGDDPLEDFSRLIVHTWRLLMRPPLTTALPGLGVELAGHPRAAAAYRERVIAPLRDGAIDAVARAADAGLWNGPDPVTSVDMLVGTFLYRLTYLGEVPDLEEVFRVAELVAGRELPRPDAA
ncbi:TetR family transcriptional regulator [Actinomyces sp. 432]|uniref:TetR/AcrR family transcriptional regulator n=1 Tax=Actinomyces sp. 432 TaxID=2057798 RepID=UPI001373ACB1|nr:TetR/AcrR family transcriptional regulator [Actinomyces sp. 432]NDR52643.1 TetR/AcrR family transcriptional regulator [Actinomyces sp. 565]QHO90880.1 TetR family transcriptional regulator [Actinomyces sp. 432]